MSYCVNCGVELRDSEKKCPLCNTVVINPNQLYNANSEPAYPKRTEAIISDENRKATFLLATAILLLPAVICGVVDYALSGGISWSFYVGGGTATLWVLMVVPFALKSHVEFKSLALDIAALLLFLYYVERVSLPKPAKSWYMPLAVPVVLVTGAAVLFVILLLRYSKLCKLQLMAAFLALAAGLLIAFEIITDLYLTETVKLEWSLIGLAGGGSLAIICLLVNRKRRLKDSLKKRIHI